MKITLLDYIKNPMGGKSNVLTNRAMYHQLYTDKFDKLLVRENGKIEYHLYRDAEKFIVWFKIPSEKIEKFYYDVVFEFTPRSSLDRVAKSIENYYVRFFSNDPAFIFTYAYVFNKNGLLFEDLVDKIGNKAKSDPPKETNPNKVIGYVKTFYFAYLTMKLKGLFTKAVFSGNGTRYFKSTFAKQIMSAKDKIDERIERGNRKPILDKAKKKIQRPVKTTLDDLRDKLRIKKTPTVNKTKSMKRTPLKRPTLRSKNKT